MKTKHPGATKSQRDALDQIGCGNYSPPMSKTTLSALLKKGLIEPVGFKEYRDRFGTIRIQEYQMPVSVHMQWCKAMSENEEIDDI